VNTHTQSSGQSFLLWHLGGDWGLDHALLISCRYWDSNTQLPGYQSDSLTIRPWLPCPNCWNWIFFFQQGCI